MYRFAGGHTEYVAVLGSLVVIMLNLLVAELKSPAEGDPGSMLLASCAEEVGVAGPYPFMEVVPG